jgi:hypothetical protein
METMGSMVNGLVTNWKRVVENAFSNKEEECIYLLVDVYNQYQENERDYVDYIFSVNNVNDVCDVLKGGMTLPNIMNVYNEHHRMPKIISPLFFVNIESIPILISWDNLKTQLKNYGEEIVENMIMYPHSYNKIAYEMIITHFIESQNKF